MKRKIKKICAVLLASAICLTTMDISVFAAENDTTKQVQAEIAEAVGGSVLMQNTISTGASVSTGDNVDGNNEFYNWDGITTEDIYESEDYKVTFKLVKYWEDGYCANIKIENIGDSTIANWYLELDFDNIISSIWDAEIYRREQDKYIIKNAEWNTNIAVGESIEFGFCGNERFTGFPKEYILLGESIEVDKEDYSIEYHLNGDWGTGFTGELVITNNADFILENWILEFDFNRTITNIWDGMIEAQEGNHYIVKNVGYNQNILPGQSVTIGFCGEEGEISERPANCRLFKYSMLEVEGEKLVSINKDNLIYSREDYYFTDEEFSLSGLISSKSYAKRAYCNIMNYKLDILKTLEIVVDSQWSIDRIPLVLGMNKVEVVVEYIDGTESNDSIWICNFDDTKMQELDIDLSDSDQDMLVNYLEDIYGTDRNVVDTDGDGISDYNELVYIGTNPIIQDTDGDGVWDGYDDADNDTISAYDEFVYGTDPSRLDSDGDMIDDYKEIFIYNTNPMSRDTDGDGAEDLWEIENGTNPLDYDKKFVVSEVANNGSMELMVELSVKGEQASTLEVENCADNYFINESIPGYLGTAFDLRIQGEFEEANVTIIFDEEFLSIENFNPTLYYYNENIGKLEEIVTEWDGQSNIVYVTLKHFSRYILLNKTAFDEVWEVEFDDSGEISVGKDIVLAIDASGSMGPQGLNNDPNNIRLEVAKKFVEKLDSTDKAAVISFERYIKTLTGFTNDRDVLYKAIDSVGNTGYYTYIGAAISKSIELFGDEQSDRERYIILLTDGKSNDGMPSYQKKCQELGIVIYTIGLGNQLDVNLLTTIATSTGGKYYHATVANDLNDVFTQVEDEIIDDKTIDENNDGITDYNAKLMCDGILRTGTGSLVFPGVSYEQLQKNFDYDGDGLKNGEELVIVSGESGTYVSIITDPLAEDSDGDSYNDYAEINNYKTNPLRYDIITSDMNYFTNDDIYLSSLFSEDYLENDWLKFQLFMGNALLNFKVDYTNSYKKSLYNYIRVLSEVSIEELALSDLTSQTSEDIYETVQATYNWVNLINEIPNDTLKLANYTETVINSTNELLELDARLAKVNNMADASEIITDIIIEKTKIQAEYMTVMSKYNREIAKYDKFNLSGKLAEKVSNMVYKLPTKLQNTISTFGKISTYGGYVFIGIDTTIDVVNTVQAFSVINAENMNYEKAFIMLNAIIENSENEELVAAATDIKYSMINQYTAFISNAEMIYEDVAIGVTQGGKIAIVAELGPLAWAVDLGLSLGDLMFNTGEVDELSLCTIALGDSSVCVSKEVENALITDTQLFYILTDDIRENLEILCQLRIVGENAFCEAADTRSFILKLFTGSQSEIEEICRDNITTVYDKALKHGIYVNPSYNGHIVEVY